MTKLLIAILTLSALTVQASSSWMPYADGGLSFVNGTNGNMGPYPSHIEYKDGYAVGGGIEHRSTESNWSQSVDVDYSHNAVKSINVGGVSQKVHASDVADSYTGTANLIYRFPKAQGGFKPYVGVGVGVSDTFGNVVPVYQGVAGVQKDLKGGWKANADVKVRRYGSVNAQGMELESSIQAIIGINVSRRF